MLVQIDFWPIAVHFLNNSTIQLDIQNDNNVVQNWGHINGLKINPKQSIAVSIPISSKVTWCRSRHQLKNGIGWLIDWLIDW
jgi:hypothetical protein